MRCSIPVVLTLAALCLAAKSDKPDQKADAPKSRPAQAALAKRDKAVHAALANYWREVQKANRAAVTDLELALKAALKSENLDEANRIKVAIADLKAELADVKQALAGKGTAAKAGKAAKVVVPGNEAWTAAGEVRKGDVLVFTATGTWSYNVAEGKQAVVPPGGTLDKGEQRDLGYLQGRVGSSVFKIGASAEIEVPEDGTLELGMLDSVHGDNSGSVTVVIKPQGAKAPVPAKPQAATPTDEGPVFEDDGE
jgi:hypothetical protein